MLAKSNIVVSPPAVDAAEPTVPDIPNSGRSSSAPEANLKNIASNDAQDMIHSSSSSEGSAPAFFPAGHLFTNPEGFSLTEPSPSHRNLSSFRMNGEDLLILKSLLSRKESANSSPASGLADATHPHKRKKLHLPSKRTDHAFREHFRDLPSSESLLADFHCAVRRDHILVQGKMFVTLKNIYFYARIIGWITQVTIPLNTIVYMERKATVGFIPNAIQIYTLELKYFFTSFSSRNETYSLLYSAWKNAQNNFPYTIDQLLAGDDMIAGENEYRSPPDSDEERESPQKEMLTRKNSNKKASTEKKNAENPSPARIKVNHPPSKLGHERRRSSSVPQLPINIANEIGHCPCKSHLQYSRGDVTLDMSVNDVYQLLFSQNSIFRREFLEKSRQNTNIVFGPWKKNSEGHLERVIESEMPFKLAFRSKPTAHCSTTETLLSETPNAHFVVESATMTPDVPNGDAFITMFRYCLVALPSPKPRSRLLMCGEVRFLKNTLFRAVIEKGWQSQSLEFSTCFTFELKKWIDEHASNLRAVPVVTVPERGTSFSRRPLPPKPISVIERMAGFWTEISLQKSTQAVLLLFVVLLFMNIYIFIQLMYLESILKRLVS